MSNVACINDACPEHGVPKDNSGGFALSEITCGKCGGPVEATTTVANREQPPEETNS